MLDAERALASIRKRHAMKAEEGHATRADAVIGATSPSEAVGGAMPARHQWLPALSMTTVQHLPGGSSDGSRQPSPITPGIDEPRTLKPPRPDVWGLRETCAAAAATPAARRQLAPVLRAHRFQASQLIAPEWDLGFAPASIAAPSGTHSTSSHPPAQSITAALGASLIPRWGMQRTASAGPRIALHGLPAGWQQHPHRSAREADDESNGGAGEDTRAAQPHAREPAVHAPLEATAGHQPAPTHKGARVASAPAYRIPGVQPRLRPPLIGGSPARSGLSQPRLTPKAAPALSMLILSPVPDSLARLGADRAAHRYDQCGPSAADERCAEPDVPASASPVDVLFATPTHQGWIGDGAASGGMRATSPVRAMAPLSPALAGAFGRDERPHPAGGQGALDGSALGEPGTPAMDTPACSSLNAARAVRAPRLDNSLTGRRPPKPRDAENEAFERPRAVQRRQGALTNGSGEHRAARDGATAHELPRAQSARALDPLVATLSAPRRARAREGVASARAIARGGGVHLDAAAKPRARRALHGQSKQRTAAGAQRCADEAAAASIVGASAAVATAGPAQDGVNASHDWLVQKQFELMLMIRCKVNSTMALQQLRSRVLELSTFIARVGDAARSGSIDKAHIVQELLTRGQSAQLPFDLQAGTSIPMHQAKVLDRSARLHDLHLEELLGEELAGMVSAMGELRQLLKVKVEDGNDFLMAERTIDELVHFFGRLGEVAAQRGCGEYELFASLR